MNEQQQLLIRAAIYRFFSAAFSFPAESVWERLQDDIATVALRGVEECGWDLTRTFAQVLQAGRESFAAEHTATFGLTAGGDLPPYESPYGAGNLFQEADCMADIAGFYRAFGLESGSGERSDHLTVELEFMQFLGLKQAYALEHGWPDKAQLCRDAQRLFLKEHLGRWALFYLRRLAKLGADSSFEAIAKAAAEWIASDCEALEVAVENNPPEIARSGSAALGANFSCGPDSCDPCEFASACTQETVCEEAERCAGPAGTKLD